MRKDKHGPHAAVDPKALDDTTLARRRFVDAATSAVAIERRLVEAEACAYERWRFIAHDLEGRRQFLVLFEMVKMAASGEIKRADVDAYIGDVGLRVYREGHTGSSPLVHAVMKHAHKGPVPPYSRPRVSAYVRTIDDALARGWNLARVESELREHGLETMVAKVRGGHPRGEATR